MKYTKELLEPIVRDSKSVAEVMKKLGLRSIAGGTHAHITRRIQAIGLDTSHFLGQRRNQGAEHVGGPAKMHWSEILVKTDSGYKEPTIKLRRAMIEFGIPYICNVCGSLAIWQGSALTLEIDHRDGDNLNNERYNVRFLCPNCHSQTPTFRGKNAGRLKEKDERQLLSV